MYDLELDNTTVNTEDKADVQQLHDEMVAALGERITGVTVKPDSLRVHFVADNPRRVDLLRAAEVVESHVAGTAAREAAAAEMAAKQAEDDALIQSFVAGEKVSTNAVLVAMARKLGLA